MTRKPRQSRSIATVNAIIDAGFICLRRYGLAGTTTNHIAEVAGLSTGSLYEYFANKEDIYAAMSERFLADIAQLIGSIDPAPEHLEMMDLIRPMAEAFTALLHRDEDRYLHLIRQILLIDGRGFADKLTQMLNDFFVQYLISHPKYTRMRHLQSTVYLIINAGIYSILRLHAAHRSAISYDELTDGLERLVKYYVTYELNALDAVAVS